MLVSQVTCMSCSHQGGERQGPDSGAALSGCLKTEDWLSAHTTSSPSFDITVNTSENMTWQPGETGRISTEEI